MAKISKSQWEFGELFPQEPVRHVLTVEQITSRVRLLLEKQVGEVWVTGEVTNFRLQSSGHVYFTLKDAAAQMQCVLFRAEPVAHRELLQDGQKVVVRGTLTVYEPRGQYQLRVNKLEVEGVGALQVKFEKLKLKLQGEGLFDSSRKRPVPRFAERIGLITSISGAAIRDVFHVVGRRNPGMKIVLAPCLVQGAAAAAEIVRAVQLLNDFSDAAVRDPKKHGAPLDLILITRGGGSLEDLWCFNEELVARAVASSKLPIVSAVGHEIDFTICDFVSDLRAATPSAAAEILTEGVFSSCQRVTEFSRRMQYLVRQRFSHHRRSLEFLADQISRNHPRKRLENSAQKLDELMENLRWLSNRRLREVGQRFVSVENALKRFPVSLHLSRKRNRVRDLETKLRRLLEKQITRTRHRFQLLDARLALLNPNQILSRGYSITFEEKSGVVVRDASGLKAGATLETRLAKGRVRSKVLGPARSNAAKKSKTSSENQID